MDTALIASHRLLESVPAGRLNDLARKCRLVLLAPEELLLSPEHKNQSLFFLLSGRLSVHLDARDSDNRLTIVPGEVIGEMSIIENKPVMAWVVAEEASTLLAMPEQVFWEEFLTIPQATRGLLQLLISRVRQTDAVLLKQFEHKMRYELLRRELESAAKIQANILPSSNPLLPGHPQVEAHAIIRPAREVGGDFFDAFAVNSHCVCFAIGDVSGKGMPAALFMVRVITLLRMCVLRHEKPALILPELNRLLCAGNDEFMFVTLAVVLLDTSTGKLIYLNGGHNPPFLSTQGQPFRLFNPAAGILLGVEPKAEFRPEELQIHPGDTLLLYTDGVPEAENSAKEGFTMERTAAALNRTGPSGGVVRFVDDLVADVAQFAGDAPQSDDITVLALRYCGKA